MASTHRGSYHGRYEASLHGLQGHRGRGLTEVLGRFAWHFKMGVGGKTVEVLSCMLCNPRIDVPKPKRLEIISIY